MSSGTTIDTIFFYENIQIILRKWMLSSMPLLSAISECNVDLLFPTCFIWNTHTFSIFKNCTIDSDTPLYCNKSQLQALNRYPVPQDLLYRFAHILNNETFIPPSIVDIQSNIGADSILVRVGKALQALHQQYPSSKYSIYKPIIAIAKTHKLYINIRAPIYPLIKQIIKDCKILHQECKPTDFIPITCTLLIEYDLTKRPNLIWEKTNELTIQSTLSHFLDTSRRSAITKRDSNLICFLLFAEHHFDIESLQSPPSSL